MPVKKFRPTTPSLRFRTVPTFEEITSTVPEKSLLEPLKKSGGRNNKGRITAYQRGGGHKRFYRKIDFKRNKHDIPARVASIEYDPNRSAFIALITYSDGEQAYSLAPQRLADQAAYISYGPARESSAPLVGDHAELGIAMGPHMPTAPDNSGNIFVYNYEWWADYRDDIDAKFQAWLAQ